jgi:adenylate cyclase
MKSVEAWELRGLKIFCLVSAVLATLKLLVQISQLNSQPPLIVTLWVGACLIWLFGTLYVASRANRAQYSAHLTVAMGATFIGVYGNTIADSLAWMELTGGDVLLVGDLAANLFLVFDRLIILGVFLARVRAVLIWVALCAVHPIQGAIALAFENQIYFTADPYVLAADNNAVNAPLFFQSFGLAIFATASLIGLTLFFRWALRSSIELEQSRENYRRYFSPDIGDEIENGDITIGQNGSRVAEIAVLFTDIAGFTKLSEKMDPQDVLNLLSEYQTFMIDAIFQHKGTVDKFIGDAVMANFGTPKSHGNDAQNAFNCGVLMNRKLDEWNEERQGAGLPVIHHRIGIHFGTCVVGNMGSEQRLEFAVIGDAVNVASRICDACKNFDSNFLISADVASRITHKLPSEGVPDVSIRGREETINLVKIYTDGELS